MTDQAAYKRITRVRNGQQKTVPIPTEVLALAIKRRGTKPVTDYLGPDMVEAIKAAAADVEDGAPQ